MCGFNGQEGVTADYNAVCFRRTTPSPCVVPFDFPVHTASTTNPSKHMPSTSRRVNQGDGAVVANKCMSGGGSSRSIDHGDNCIDHGDSCINDATSPSSKKPKAAENCSSRSTSNSVLFPIKLYNMLEESAKNGFEDIVRWVPTGGIISDDDGGSSIMNTASAGSDNGSDYYNNDPFRCSGFIVYDREAFVSNILPRYFGAGDTTTSSSTPTITTTASLTKVRTTTPPRSPPAPTTTRQSNSDPFFDY